MTDITMEKIESLTRLKELAYAKKAVYCPSSHIWSQPKPAAFIINMPGQIIERLFSAGFFVYQKREKKTQIERRN